MDLVLKCLNCKANNKAVLPAISKPICGKCKKDLINEIGMMHIMCENPSCKAFTFIQYENPIGRQLDNRRGPLHRPDRDA